MSITLWRVVGAALFVLVIFFSGYWLHRSGRPFSGLVLTAHKLVALAAAVLLVIVVYRAVRADELGPLGLVAGLVSGLLFLGTGITGGLVSASDRMPAAVAAVHRLAPYLTVLTAALALYLLPSA